MKHTFLFENPIRTKKINSTEMACIFINGCVNINGQKYFGYSMTDAIKEHRRKKKLKI